MWNLLPGTVFRGCEPVFGQSGRLNHILGRDVERPGIFFSKTDAPMTTLFLVEAKLSLR